MIYNIIYIYIYITQNNEPFPVRMFPVLRSRLARPRPLLVVVLTTPGHPIQLAPTPPRLAQSLLALAARLVAIAAAGRAGLP